MSIYGNFLQRSDECLRMAQKAGTRRDRDLFLDMATAWLGMAEQREGKAMVRGMLSGDRPRAREIN